MKKIYEYFTLLPSVNYFNFISLRMKDIISDLNTNINNLDPYEDLIDLTLFINDLLSLEQPKINYIVRNSIFYYFLLPEIFQSLFVLIYGDDMIKNKNNNIRKKNSIVILCFLTFLINIKDETVMYIILHLLFSENIPEKIERYILKMPEINPFYCYKWNKNFQKDIDFSKFISLNYSNKFLGSFLNMDNYYLKNMKRVQFDLQREMETIALKCEEINLRGKLEKLNYETILYEMSQFIFDLFNQNAEAFGQMKNYHSNLSNGLGIKVGVIKEMFNNPNDTVYMKNKKKVDEKTDINKIDYINTDIIKNSFMCDYKQWMENLNNKEKSNIKFKPNIFRITLFNLLNNENNIDVDIPLLIINNYLIWCILHKLNIPKKILEHFQLHKYSLKEKNDIKKEINKTAETPKDINSEDYLYKLFTFDNDYLMKNYESKKEPNFNTNLNMIEKLCINLENKIILAKVELIYIELICKNINSLCVDDDPNKDKIIQMIKSTALKLIKLLINFLQIPESGFIEPESSFEETVCIYVKQMATNINDESLYNQQLGNLPKIMEIGMCNSIPIETIIVSIWILLIPTKRVQFKFIQQ
jgi:hypothetical protein